MNLKSYLNPKYLPIAAEAARYVRAVAYRFALHETGALLCASAPWVYRAGETLQHWSSGPPQPTASRTTEPSFDGQSSSPYAQSAANEDPSSFDF